MTTKLYEMLWYKGYLGYDDGCLSTNDAFFADNGTTIDSSISVPDSKDLNPTTDHVGLRTSTNLKCNHLIIPCRRKTKTRTSNIYIYN